MFHENQNDTLVNNQNTTSPPDFLILPNLLPNSGFRQHRRSRSGVEVRQQPDLTHDLEVYAAQVGNRSADEKILESQRALYCFNFSFQTRRPRERKQSLENLPWMKHP